LADRVFENPDFGRFEGEDDKQYSDDAKHRQTNFGALQG
jgi:hypothetical protein